MISDVEINTNAIDVTSEAKEVIVTFRARDNFGVNATTEGANAGMSISMTADGYSLPSSGQYESVTYFATNYIETSERYLPHTLERLSGDNLDGLYEFKFTVPTSAHPDTISRNTIGDQTHRKKWEIRLEVEDDTNHGQTYYLYNPENLDDGFSITNQKFEHELPYFTATLNRSLSLIHI